MAHSIRVAVLEELPPGRGKQLELADRQITVYNVAGRFHATAGRRARVNRPPVETDCSAPGLVFEAYAEDSPADLGVDGEVGVVRVEEGIIWLDLPGE